MQVQPNYRYYRLWHIWLCFVQSIWFRLVIRLAVYGDEQQFSTRKDKYQADIETTDGLGFVYACLSERQPFYQLNLVEKKLATREKNTTLTLENLNLELIELLQKI